ncbi:hypothetical protein [Burkholderia gladioli]|uniref:hypothetical protein n=1 Tax=Burkholderia gladioli TaxID=28095 RepID=UPI001640107B|nr:hypothetical protein [Burkholderia gladioli]MBU9172931.1 hypothetical protein [Burkholderia gladioli]MBU9385705.1 hypothetical protein [Burkholderia gladioli]MDN7807303.1 hypothetical protein [Burkholderia gladioli]
MDFEVIRDGVDDAKPLLYQWEIHDSRTGDLLARYIGKAVRGSKRPLRHYDRNVRRLIAGMAYRKSKPDGFRRVHRALADAVTAGHRITLTLLRNVGPDEDINEAERRAIHASSCTLNG